MTTDASCNMRNADLLQGTKLLHETGAVSEQASKEAVGPPSKCSKTQGPEQPYLVLELSLFEQEIGIETVEVVPTFFFFCDFCTIIAFTNCSPLLSTELTKLYL